MQDELDPDLTDKQLRALQKNTGQTCQELGDRVGSTASLVGKIYRDLARKGLVRFEDN
jgi:predicted transcriptional regulator